MNIASTSELVSKGDVSAEPVLKPSVLFITPTIPLLSGKGSSMRGGMHVLALSRLYDVHVLVLARFGMEPDLVPEPELAAKMASIIIVNAHINLHGNGKSGSSNLDILKRFFLRPRLASRFTKHDIGTILKPLDNQKFDLIFFGRLSTGLLMESTYFRKWAGNTPRILDIDDIESEATLREAKAIRLKRGRIGYLSDVLDAVKLAFIEQHLFKRFDEVLVCSSSDQAKMMRRHPKILFGVLPNGFRVPALRPERSDPEVPTLLFVGFLQYLPNEDGILFFCNEVLPLIRRRLGLPIRLLVIGRKPPRSVLNLERIPEVTVIGDVPKVEPYYQSATMAIVPIRFGGGTRIKILEALALGCPVVSTTLGAEGIEVHNGENILLADTATEIADACIRLAEDKMLRANLSQKGWEMVNANYSADAVAGRLADCIRAIPVNKNSAANVGDAPMTSNSLITENS